MQDVRQRRWAWWRSLATIGIYVQELYMHTQWNKRRALPGLLVPNAVASGQPGQEVVKSVYGTVTWHPNDKRILVAPGNKELDARIAAGFEPWDPERDLEDEDARHRRLCAGLLQPPLAGAAARCRSHRTATQQTGAPQGTVTAEVATSRIRSA